MVEVSSKTAKMSVWVFINFFIIKREVLLIKSSVIALNFPQLYVYSALKILSIINRWLQSLI
jgi:hypothetical protein